MDSNALSVIENGDCELAVAYSDDCDTFIVSSAAMSLASPVWNKIMNSPFGEREDLGKRRISFMEDNAEALLVLLHIAHLRFNQVPSSLSFPTLFNLSVLCDKYDCIDITQPWIHKWLTGMERLSEMPGREGWLFMAWALGKEDIFEWLATKLVREVSINDAGNCILSNGEILPSPMPPGIVESILSIRQITVTRLVDITDRYVNRFLKNTGYVCRLPKEQSQCDALVFGSLILGLRKLQLWPEKEFDTNTLSINAFATVLKALTVYQWPDGSYPNRIAKVPWSHSSCDFTAEYQAAIDAVLNSIPTPVLGEHRRHIQAQKKKVDPGDTFNTFKTPKKG